MYRFYMPATASHRDLRLADEYLDAAAHQSFVDRPRYLAAKMVGIRSSRQGLTRTRR